MWQDRWGKTERWLEDKENLPLDIEDSDQSAISNEAKKWLYTAEEKHSINIWKSSLSEWGFTHQKTTLKRLQKIHPCEKSLKQTGQINP